VVSYFFYRKASQDLRQEFENHYVKASQDLRREAGDLRYYVEALISYLEQAGHINVVRDEKGRPIKTQILQGGGIQSREVMGGGEIVQEAPPAGPLTGTKVHRIPRINRRRGNPPYPCSSLGYCISIQPRYMLCCLPCL
jgi:hypothetical protein